MGDLERQILIAYTHLLTEFSTNFNTIIYNFS